MKKLFCLVFSLLTFLTVSCGTQRAAAPNGIVYPKHGLDFLRVLGRIVR